MEVIPKSSMHFKVNIGKPIENCCSLLKLPSKLYVDWDEIDSLYKVGRLGSTKPKLLYGNTNVEIPESDLNENDKGTLILLSLENNELTIPIHARYPKPMTTSRTYWQTGKLKADVEIQNIPCQRK